MKAVWNPLAYSLCYFNFYAQVLGKYSYRSSLSLFYAKELCVEDASLQRYGPSNWVGLSLEIKQNNWNVLKKVVFVQIYSWCSNVRPPSSIHSWKRSSRVLRVRSKLPVAGWRLLQSMCHLTHTCGSRKQTWHIPNAVCTVWAPDDGRKNRLKYIQHWQQ